MNDLTFSTGTLPVGDCPEDNSARVFSPVVNTLSLTGPTASSVTGVFPASDSSIAFTTYLASGTTTGAILPGYKPAASGVGTAAPVTLSGGATAPVFGVFASDNKTFFVGTSGDNQVHLILEGKAETWPAMSKEQVARLLVERIAERLTADD